MLRSKTTPGKRKPLWPRGTLRISADVEAPLRAKAQERGGTMQDEIELALTAHLEVPVPDRYLPETREEITPFDKVIMRMRRHNGEQYKSIADDYGMSWQCVRRVAR
jgi:hypothetical protein